MRHFMIRRGNCTRGVHTFMYVSIVYVQKKVAVFKLILLISLVLRKAILIRRVVEMTFVRGCFTLHFMRMKGFRRHKRRKREKHKQYICAQFHYHENIRRGLFLQGAFLLVQDVYQGAGVCFCFRRARSRWRRPQFSSILSFDGFMRSRSRSIICSIPESVFSAGVPALFVI